MKNIPLPYSPPPVGSKSMYIFFALRKAETFLKGFF